MAPLPLRLCVVTALVGQALALYRGTMPNVLARQTQCITIPSAFGCTNAPSTPSGEQCFYCCPGEFQSSYEGLGCHVHTNEGGCTSPSIGIHCEPDNPA